MNRTKKWSLKNWLMENVSLKNYGSLHERLNSLTHLAGTLITAGFILVILIRQLKSPGEHLLPVMVYAVCMLILYCSSTIYHALKHPVAKRLFRMLDHTNIYLLIAGTYTPIMLATGEPQFARFLAIVWGVALIGMLTTLFFWERFKILHVLSYLAMGWMVVLVGKPLFSNELMRPVLPWALAGGISYTVGVLLYAIRKIPYHHAIWHLFVFSGSAMFLAGIVKYLIP